MSSVFQGSELALVLMWISWDSPRPSTRSCTWIQVNPTINTDWGMESSSAGKDLDILVDEKLAMNQQCVLAASWAAWWPSGQGRWFSHSALPRSHLEYCIWLWGLQYRVVPEDRHKNYQRAGTSLLWKRCERWSCSAWRRFQSDVIMAF